MNRRAFSVLELVFSMAILSIVMIGIFWVFEMGQHSFHFASLRQGLQAEARIVYLQMHTDLRHSSYVSVTTIARQANVVLPMQEAKGPQTLDRYGLCLAGVEQWSAPGATDPVTGFPNFDSYVVYYGTSEPEGRLIRQIVKPAIVGPYLNSQFSLAGSMNENPILNVNRVGTARNLSKRVLSFNARRDDGKRLVYVSLKFRAMGGKKPGGAARADETFELTLRSFPENTYPKV
ncbi:hypothetical protein IV102_13690 [bacterium]|nr:hypothetical protein [bacterium]